MKKPLPHPVHILYHCHSALHSPTFRLKRQNHSHFSGLLHSHREFSVCLPAIVQSSLSKQKVFSLRLTTDSTLLSYTIVLALQRVPLFQIILCKIAQQLLILIALPLLHCHAKSTYPPSSLFICTSTSPALQGLDGLYLTECSFQGG